MKPARPGRKYSPPASRRKQKPSSESRTARSGLPSPAAIEVAEPRDQHVAYLNLGRHPLGRAVGQHDVDGGDRRLAVAHAELHLLDTVGLDRSCRAFAIVEAPDAALVRRQDALDRDSDAVVGGTEIRFAFTVAIAEFQEPAATVDAQSLDRVARPAAAVARGRQPLLGRQNAVSAGFDVAAEVGLAAEQAEPVLHLPFDPGAVGLGVGSTHAAYSRRAQRSGREQRFDACSSIETEAAGKAQQYHAGWGGNVRAARRLARERAARKCSPPCRLQMIGGPRPTLENHWAARPLARALPARCAFVAPPAHVLIAVNG